MDRVTIYTLVVTEGERTHDDTGSPMKFHAELAHNGIILSQGWGEFAVDAANEAIANGVSDEEAVA